MKKIFTLSLAFVLAGSLLGCGKEESVTYYETKTYIQQDTGDINFLERTYDENWNLLLQYTTLNGNFASQVEHEYSEDYTVMTTKTTSAIYEPDTSKVIRTFDEKGQVIKAETYDGDRHISTSEYTYDENGEKILIRSTQPGSDIVVTTQRIFDDRGNLVTYIQDTGYYVSRYEYAYDKNDHRIREEHYRDDEMTSYCDFTWEGNTGTGTDHKADGTPVVVRILEYDDAGNLLRYEIRDLLGTVTRLSCYEYIGTDGSISSGIPEQ